MRLNATVTLLLLLASGCAHYEYDLVAPPELTRHIATKVDSLATIDPLEYRMRTVENRLVLRIFNPTENTIQLLGDQSSVVDPEGQSHPLRSAPIAPRSFLKLILPPPRPRVYDPGPTFGFGVGMGMSHYYDRDPYYYYSPLYGPPYEPYYYRYYDAPRYLYVYDDTDPRFWEWEGDGDARLTLFYQAGKEKPIRHELTFRRRKT